MRSSDLQGRVIAVTGGFGALGRATGTTLLAKGANVALIDVTQLVDSSANPACLMIGGTDMRTAGTAAAVFARVSAAFGRIDGLVNVAGGFSWQKVDLDSLAVWDRMYDINLRTAVTAAAAVLPHLKAHGRGRIVNVGAIAAGTAAAGMGAYAAAKAGVARLTEALSEELKDHGINVNAVLPSILDTPANRVEMPDADHTRWVQPTDLAEVIAFLLSDAASAVTGALIPVKGRV